MELFADKQSILTQNKHCLIDFGIKIEDGTEDFEEKVFI